MKIVYLNDDYPPQSFGGAGIVAKRIADEMSFIGNDVVVITTVKAKRDEGVTFDGQIKVVRIYSDYHERWRAYLSLWNIPIAFRVAKILYEEKPDIVHAHNVHKHISYHVLKIAKQLGARVFLTAHDTMLVDYGKTFPKAEEGMRPYVISWKDQMRTYRWRYNPLRNYLIRRYMRYVDKVFVVSSCIENLLNLNGILNTVTIQNGIGTTNLGYEIEAIKKLRDLLKIEDRPILLFGGRLSRAKGAEKAIIVLEEVAKMRKDVVLLVLGKVDEYTDKLLEKASSLGIRDNIKFTGWISGDKLRAAYEISEIVLVPSLYFDPFPTINLEAMSYGKPVIGTCFGGTNEVVLDGVTGYIINPNNTKHFAEKIMYLLNNVELRRSFGVAGSLRVKEGFSLTNQIKNLLHYYENKE